MSLRRSRRVLAILALSLLASLDAATSELARELAGYLSRARREPGLQFDPPR